MSREDFFRSKGRGHDHAAAVAAHKGMPGFHLLKAKRNFGAAALPLDLTGLCQYLQTSAGGPGIRDQKEVGACEGYAHSSGVTLLMASRKTPVKLISAIGWYQCALLIQRQPNADGTMPALIDSGTEPSIIQQAAMTYGIASVEAWGNEPATPESVIVQPVLDQLEAAQAYLIVGMYAIQSTGDQYLTDVLTAWANGYPVTAAIDASSPTFNNYTGGILSAMGNNIDHATLLPGGTWDGKDLESIVGRGVNSWGDGNEGDPAWGESDAPGITAGMYRCDASFLLAYSKVSYVLDVVPIKTGEVLI
jgi:hypothetical protein